MGALAPLRAPRSEPHMAEDWAASSQGSRSRQRPQLAAEPIITLALRVARAGLPRSWSLDVLSGFSLQENKSFVGEAHGGFHCVTPKRAVTSSFSLPLSIETKMVSVICLKSVSTGFRGPWEGAFSSTPCPRHHLGSSLWVGRKLLFKENSGDWVLEY